MPCFSLKFNACVNVSLNSGQSLLEKLRRFSILHSHIRHVRKDRFWQRFGYESKHRHLPLIRVKSVHKVSATRTVLSSCSLKSIMPALEIDAEVSFSRQILGDEVDIYRRGSLETYGTEEDRERERREKIGLANKGRIPWNKGKQHDEETRELIKQNTIEALKNPKVRLKMAERHRSHSDQAKKKISLSQKRVWAKRLKSKRLRTRFFHSWAKSIAEAAKTGGAEEEMLAWNSYEKIKDELHQRHLNRDIKNEKKEALKQIRIAKKEALEKIRIAKKMAQVTVKQMEIARKSKLREEKKMKKEKIAEEKRRLRRGRKDSKNRLRLKERLNQIRQRISRDNEASPVKSTVSQPSVLENLDLELMKSESSQRRVSLADQIKAAKSKKAEFATIDAPERTP